VTRRQALTDPQKTALKLSILCLAALAVRVAMLRVSMMCDADGAARVFIAWDWLSHPRLFPAGHWPPLHTYLIGIALWMHRDILLTPIAVSIALGVLTCVPIYLFTAAVFGRRGAMLAAAVAALYPLGLRYSLVPMSEVPFAFFLAWSMYWLAKAREEQGDKIRYAVLSGAALALTGMIRLEAWILVPLLAVVLFPNRRKVVWFLCVAASLPALWMMSDWIRFGSPLYSSIGWDREWRALTGAYQTPTARDSFNRVVFFPEVWFFWLTPPVAMTVIAGVVSCLQSNRRRLIWLVPPAGLLATMIVKHADPLVMGDRYVYALTTLTIPFVAQALGAFGQWEGMLSAIVLTAMALCSWANYRVPFIDVEIVPYPRFPLERREPLRQIAADLRAEGERGGAVVFDGWDSRENAYLETAIGLEPPQMFLTSGIKNVAFDVPALGRFLQSHPKGALVLRQGAVLAERVEEEPDGRLSVDGLCGVWRGTRRREIEDVTLFDYAFDDRGCRQGP